MPSDHTSAELPCCRVLVVDDTPGSSFVLGKLLEKLGQDVKIVSSACAALEWVQHNCPDLVISDISMPEMDGYELARRLRLHPATRSSLLVALTGYDDAADKRRAAEAGFGCHLVKPVSIAQLRELISDYPSLAARQTASAQ